MKHIIIGTAGHIDHGKTAIVKELTGVDTDTLEEEKKRGITINNGYTYFKLNDETLAGLIDMPGHEKFIKNMLAGVSSIDIVILVIAADEGIMPQTREHFEILKILNIKKGIVVLSKCDLVDKEWLEFMRDEIKEFTSGSFLEEAKIIESSIKTGSGITEIKEEINNLIDKVEEKDREELFRLPIDRVFNVKGFGTVVTGSVISGSINLNDEIEINPGYIKAKVRGLQVHRADVKTVIAGERAAINVNVDSKESLERGMFIGEVSKSESSYIISAKLKLIDNFEGKLINRQRVRAYHYSKEVMGRIILLDKEELKAGEEYFIQLRLEEEIVARKNDKLVIRTYSPMNTIAGAIILDANAKKVKRFKDEYINILKIKDSNDLETIIENIIFENSERFIDEKEVFNISNIELDQCRKAIKLLLENKKIIKLNNDAYIHNRYLINLINKTEKILKEFYKENPLKVGLDREALRSKLFSAKIKINIFNELLVLLEQRNIISQKFNIIKLKCYKIILNKSQENIKNILLKTYKENPFSAPRFDEIIKNEKNKTEFKLVLDFLIQDKKLIFLDDGLIVDNESYEEVKEKVIKFLNENKIILLSDLKEILNASRRYLVAFLENLDRNKITKRNEEGRILFKEN